MNLQFGFWDHFERRKGIPIAQQYRERMELVALAEQYGFYGYHVAEHHLTPLDLAPSQIVYLAAVAQHTTRIRLGTMVLCLPLYHPVRLLQEVCMLDQLSGGRFMPGVGRGVRSIEHEWFGVPATEANDRFEETLSLLIAAMQTGMLSYNGSFYNYKNVPLDLEPIQKPYPPFWYAGNLETAGRKGMNVVGAGNISGDAIRMFRELWLESRASENVINPQVTEPMLGSSRHVLVADSDKEAIRIANRALPVLNANFLATPLSTTGNRQLANALPSPYTASTVEEASKSTRLIVGSPKTVSEQLGDYLCRVPVDYNYVVNAFQWGDITHQEASYSLDLFAHYVMPTLITARSDAEGVKVA